MDELEKNARKYTYLEKPAEFLTIEDLTHLEIENDGEEADEELPMYVLTNKQKQFGAGVIFYPGIMEQAANLLGDHFYILPSSIHGGTGRSGVLLPEKGQKDLYLESGKGTVAVNSIHKFDIHFRRQFHEK